MHDTQTLPPRAMKLIDRALCPAAEIGEAENAITKALPIIRAAGIGSANALAASIGVPVHVPPVSNDREPDVMFPFGRHYGQLVVDIWDTDRGYCKWWRENIEVDGKYADEIAECHDAIDWLVARRKRGQQ